VGHLYNMGVDLVAEMPVREPVLMAQVAAIDHSNCRVGIAHHHPWAKAPIVAAHSYREKARSAAGAISLSPDPLD